MKPRVLLHLFMTSVLAGCGPSLQSLVHKKHYREAICAGYDGYANDRHLVARALDQDADLLLHLHVVSPDELRPVLGVLTESTQARAKILRIQAQTNILPIDQLELQPAFRTDTGQTTGTLVDWPSLAWLTHEKLPPKRLASTYMTGENVLKGGAAIFTLGLSLLFTEFRPGTIEVDAPLSEFQRLAPLASALHVTLGRSTCTKNNLADGAGQTCQWHFLLDAVSQAPINLVMNTRYLAYRVTKNPHDTGPKACNIDRTRRLPLGTPSTIENNVNTRFQSEMIPLRSLLRE